MQVSIETTAGLERRLTVAIPSERIEKEVDARLGKAAKTIRLDGFRKGKVPIKVVKQRFGADVRQEVVGEVINRTFFEAVIQEKVNPAGQPSIDSIKDQSGEDLEYVATFEVYPEITLADLSQVTVTRQVAEVADADVDKMIEVLRQQQAKWVEVERPARQDDQVNIDYTGTREGEEFEGGKAEKTNLVIGSGQMIPGFEDSLIGMKAGEEKTVSLQFPEDYHAENLKGAAVEFKIRVNKVSEKVVPELDQDFFKLFGVEEGGLDNFRDEVSGNMQRELKSGINNKLKNRMISALLEVHEFPVPSALLKSEISVLKKQMLQQFGNNSPIDESALPDELFTQQAERRVKSGLLFSEIVKVNELAPDPEKVRAKIEEIASTYEEPEEVINYYYSNEQMLKNVESLVAEDQIVEFLEKKLQVIEEPVSYEEAVKPDPEPSAGDED